MGGIILVELQAGKIFPESFLPVTSSKLAQAKLTIIYRR
ncbi:MAG: hypothetical protein ACI9MF_002204 [Gammaproteobacteria bacterium]|jgi:hypothetical protein